MSFFSNTVGLIKEKVKGLRSGSNLKTEGSVVKNDDIRINNAIIGNTAVEIAPDEISKDEFDFQSRDYVKESQSVAIKNPISTYLFKFIRTISLTITGTVSFLITLIFGLVLFYQYGTIENTMISTILLHKLQKSFPDMNLSLGNAHFKWNPDEYAVELELNKLNLDDLSIPKLIILPDYKKSFEKQQLITKNISLIKPKIFINLPNNSDKILINLDLEKASNLKANMEDFSVITDLKPILDRESVIKLINASVFIKNSNSKLKLNNLNVDYDLKTQTIGDLKFSTKFAGQNFATQINLKNAGSENGQTNYNLNFNVINPVAVSNSFSKTRLAFNDQLLNILSGYNLPVSGEINFKTQDNNIINGDFNLVASSGAIRLLSKNMLSRNLGKRIDSANMIGTFSKDTARINSLNVAYGKAGLQLTGISIPLDNFNLLNRADINGTLNLSNVEISDIKKILPDTISESAMALFKNYLPDFKLEAFKVDLSGPVFLDENEIGDEKIEKLNISQGMFKIKNASVPLGNQLVEVLSATGNILEDGIDIRLKDARLGDTKINKGRFFLSTKDDSWIGKINTEIPVEDITDYTDDLSQKLADLPLERLNLTGIAKCDLKIIKVNGDKALNKDNPFKILACNGTLNSKNSFLKFSWDNVKINIDGIIYDEGNKINVSFEENLKKNEAKTRFEFGANSDFLKEMFPSLTTMCKGDFKLALKGNMKEGKEYYDVDLNLKNASLRLPILGNMKTIEEDGRLQTNITKSDNIFKFSNFRLDTKNNKIQGKILVYGNGTLMKCALDKFEINGCKAKINLLRENDKEMILSAVGDSIDLHKIMYTIDRFNPDLTIGAYLNLKELLLSRNHKIKDVKGNIKIKNGRLISGACYGIIGDNTTVALNTRELNDSKNSLTSISFSDAGALLKYLKITDTVSGGSINFVTKCDGKSDKPISGAFEISDFVVNNSKQLQKLIAFSSPNLMPTSNTMAVGFNFCVGNITFLPHGVKITEGRAISPSIGISYSGSYDRKNDELDIEGTALPMSSILSGKSSNGALSTNYRLFGSFNMPVITVEPIKFAEMPELANTFGNLLPISILKDAKEIGIGEENRKVFPSQNPEDFKDPFSRSAFDNMASDKKTEKDVKVDENFGVKIIRGSRKK